MTNSIQDSKILVSVREGTIEHAVSMPAEEVIDAHLKSSELARVSRSEAIHDIDGTQARPSVTINQSRIIVSLLKTGGAYNPACHLDGPNGSYTFVASGVYNVVAGTYSHWVGGAITVPYLDGVIWRYDGRLTSLVEYS